MANSKLTILAILSVFAVIARSQPADSVDNIDFNQTSTLYKPIATAFSPTVYAHLAVHRTPLEIDLRLQAHLDLLDAGLEMYERYGNSKIRSMAKRTRAEAANEAKTLKNKVILLTDTMHLQKPSGGTSSDQELHRNKRMAPLVVGAAAGVGALIVATAGMTVWNRVDIDDIKDRLEHLEGNLDDLEEDVANLIVATDARFDAVDDTFRLVNETLATHGAYEAVKHLYLINRVAMAEIRSAIESWEEAWYALLSGHLHPAFVNVSSINSGISAVAQRASQYGMKVVPMGRDAEAFFAMPITAISNGTGIHILIPIPLTPVRAPVFDVLQVIKEPIHVKDDVYLNLGLNKEYLLMSRDKSLHAELTPVEFASCDSFKQFRFCDVTQFQRKANTCASALYYGDKDLAKQLCRRHLSKQSLVVTPVVGSLSKVRVRASEAVSVMAVCSNDKDRAKANGPLQRVADNEEAIFDLRPGCFLQAEDKVVFLTHSPNRVELAVVGDNWALEDVLENFSPEEVASYFEDNKLRKAKASFQEFRASFQKRRVERRLRKATTLSLHNLVQWGAMAALFLFCAIPLAYVGYRIYLVRRSDDSQTPDNSSEEDNVPSSLPPAPSPTRASLVDLEEGPPVVETRSGHIVVTSTMNPRAAAQASDGPISMLSLTHLGETGYAHIQPAALRGGRR